MEDVKYVKYIGKRKYLQNRIYKAIYDGFGGYYIVTDYGMYEVNKVFETVDKTEYILQLRKDKIEKIRNRVNKS